MSLTASQRDRVRFFFAALARAFGDRLYALANKLHGGSYSVRYPLNDPHWSVCDNCKLPWVSRTPQGGCDCCGRCWHKREVIR